MTSAATAAQTAPQPAIARPTQLGRDLAAVLRTVAPAGLVVLVGHSMGGMTIMAVARQCPELAALSALAVGLVRLQAYRRQASMSGHRWHTALASAARRARVGPRSPGGWRNSVVRCPWQAVCSCQC